MSTVSLLARFAALAVLLFLVGCGGPRLAEVKGTVNYDGKPLKEGDIGFMPDKGRPSYGKIAEGQIVDVTTTQKGDGLPPGSYKVQITATSDAEDIYKAKSILPAQYGDAEKSGLTADIKSGTNTLTFELKSK
jgi:hypothetical protein